MTSRAGSRALRRPAAAVVFAFFMFWSVFLSYLIGWSVLPEGPQRVADDWPILIPAVLSGLLAVIGARIALGRTILTWWLLLALPLPTIITLQQAGWL